jgi:hypothetical protein
MLPCCLGPVGTRRTPELLPKDIRRVCTPERHDELVRAFQRQRRPNLLDAANDNPVNAAVPASSAAVNLRSYALPFVHALGLSVGGIAACSSKVRQPGPSTVGVEFLLARLGRRIIHRPLFVVRYS